MFDRMLVGIINQTEWKCAASGLNAGGAVSWSPDSRYLAISANRDGFQRIYLVHRTGGEVRTLQVNASTTNASGGTTMATDTEPAWSPDGTRIVFSRLSGDQSGLFSVPVNAQGDAATTEPTRLTTGRHQFPMFSPDGSQMVFINRVSGKTDVFTCNGDGSSVMQLTATSSLEGSADW
jgi:TolB protein